MQRYLVVALFLFILSGCTNLRQENESLREKNTELESQLNEYEEQISKFEKELANRNMKQLELQEEFKSLTNELDDSNQIIEILTDEINSNERINLESELSQEEIGIWNSQLENIMYFIPDFIDIQEIDKTELIEAVFLYGTYENKLDLSGVVSDDRLDEVCVNLFGEPLLVHQNFELANYIDGEYVASGFSYHETRIAFVNKIIPIGNKRVVMLQQFSMGEDDWINNKFANISDVLDALEKETFKPKYLGEYIVVLENKENEDYTLKIKLKLAD